MSWRARAAAAFTVSAIGQMAAWARRSGNPLPLLLRGDAVAPLAPPLLISRRGQPGARIAVVMHVHYPDVLPDLLAQVERIPEPWDLIVTTTALDAPALEVMAKSVRVFAVRNRGRDILPLLRLARSGVLDGYELVCKVHTKRSVWRASGGRFTGDGAEWRDALTTGLLGSRHLVERILAPFDAHPDLMVVTAPGQILGPRYWGANLPLVRWLGRRGGLPIRPRLLRFPAGSMYWARADLMRELGALGLSEDAFDVERGQDDGTTAHAIERYLGYLVTARGRMVTSDCL